MKHIISISLVILVFCNMVNTANARSSTAAVINPITCKQWLDRKGKLSEGDPYVIWLQGYISGANAIYDDTLDRDFLKGAQKISLIDWTTVYCQKYPDSMVHDGANALIKKLQNDMTF